MLSFAASYDYLPHLPVPVNKYVVRIGRENGASINAFKKVGFEVTKVVEVFQEVEMRPKESVSLVDWTTGHIVSEFALVFVKRRVTDLRCPNKVKDLGFSEFEGAPSGR